MAFTEITQEIDEQITDITNSITTYQAQITDATAAISRLEEQLTGLTQLRANAQALIDNQDKVDINLNVNVTTDSNSEASVVRHSSATQV